VVGQETRKLSQDKQSGEQKTESALWASMRRAREAKEAEAAAEESIERLVQAGALDEVAQHLSATSQDFQLGYRLGLIAGTQTGTEA
jgi:hypothetical protein